MDGRAPLRLLACEAAADLAAGVARHLEVPVIGSKDVWFSGGEGKHVIDENIRGADVYLFQNPVLGNGVSDGRTPYDRLIMLLHAIDAARHADAARVSVVMPYLIGARQDKRKGRTREGVSTGLFARMLDTAGASMVIAVEPHNEAIAGCYDPTRCVFEPVYGTHAFGRWLSAQGLVGDVIASTDVGGLQLARRFAKLLERDIVALSKERDYSKPNRVTRTTVIGEVAGRNVTVIDDMIDTAGSAVSAAEALWAAGAKDIILAAIHPVFSDPAWERMHGLAAAAAERGVRFAVAGTSSVHHATRPAWYHEFALEPLLADVIRSVNARRSVRGVTEEDG